MLYKLLFSVLITLLMLEVNIPLGSKPINKDSLINRFCRASLKSKLNIKDKKKISEISYYTCNCFLEKYQSGATIRSARSFCKNEAADKYNL